MSRTQSKQTRQTGFTLAELAIATAIIGLLLGGMFISISTQLHSRQISETRKTLEQAREALIGYALANGRLPCPAAPAAIGAGSGTESPAGGTTACNNPHNGNLPGTTLGIAPTDPQGYVIDAWGNRIQYAVTNVINGACGTPCFTTTGNKIKAEFLSNTLLPDLQVCSTSTGMVTGGSAACASDSVRLTANAVAVIYSLGKNKPTGGTGLDEAKNLDNDRGFVWHEETESGATNGVFDDIMVWLSPNTLYARMAAAGAL